MRFLIYEFGSEHSFLGVYKRNLLRYTIEVYAYTSIVYRLPIIVTHNITYTIEVYVILWVRHFLNFLAYNCTRMRSLTTMQVYNKPIQGV